MKRIRFNVWQERIIDTTSSTTYSEAAEKILNTIGIPYTERLSYPGVNPKKYKINHEDLERLIIVALYQGKKLK